MEHNIEGKATSQNSEMMHVRENGATEHGIEEDHDGVETMSTILALYCAQLENDLLDDTMMFQ